MTPPSPRRTPRRGRPIPRTMTTLLKTPPPHCISLIGMMGSGKTTVGRALAQRLGWSFIDLDAHIALQEGRSIPEIFSLEGEAAFRALELRSLSSLLSGPSALSATVLSLGGGTVLQPACAATVREHSLCVRLSASAATLCERLRSDGQRPLLRGPEPLETKLERLLSEREPAYTAAADITVATDSRSVEDIVEEIISRIR